MAKRLVGVVMSDKADKSIVVKVVTHKTHPIYKKQYISSKKFMAHDEKNEAKTGDKKLVPKNHPHSTGILKKEHRSKNRGQQNHNEQNKVAFSIAEYYEAE